MLSKSTEKGKMVVQRIILQYFLSIGFFANASFTNRLYLSLKKMSLERKVKKIPTEKFYVLSQQISENYSNGKYCAS